MKIKNQIPDFQKIFHFRYGGFYSLNQNKEDNSNEYKYV